MRFELRPHPDTPPTDPAMAIEVWFDRWPDGRAEISYHVHAAPDSLVLPERPGRGRADELWKTTCFELFVSTAAGGYTEYNFAPSGAWAAYAFDAYRSGMRPLELDHPPEIQADETPVAFILDAVIDLHEGSRIGLSAVIEESSGTRSYWALAHPEGKPDFHDKACFAAALPPIEQP